MIKPDIPNNRTHVLEETPQPPPSQSSALLVDAPKKNKKTKEQRKKKRTNIQKITPSPPERKDEKDG
jgi:hypothetical protein